VFKVRAMAEPFMGKIKKINKVHFKRFHKKEFNCLYGKK